MGRFKGRSTVACTVCHSQKLKCDGAHPCGRCARRQRDCVYPVKTTYVTVPEAYLRGLERAAVGSRPSSSFTPSFADDVPEYSRQSQSPSDPGTSTRSRVAARALISDDCSAERFVYDLRQMALPESPDGLQQQATTFMYGSQPSGEIATEQAETPTPPGSDMFE
ncbi:hypothetical protein FVEG_17104 [Fusarium verticillioides 7600]|uniref:Zn(2)-C6 fungal-type domain-containing protein n=1 Tax=Gibberella moniliformis (strain M3125 / FGSC 7600) TaxID=334819 RepID=W7MQM0_GIBM7|nr:hypothetical protein FVEG_17104 [Fusarium verticillioides 7600]EWG53371.1 hypothetical protein FVEG_17104 [Fusarium verticillioides 7600]